MGGLARRASAQMPASAGLSCIVVRSARGLPDLEPDVGGRVAPDPPLRAVPEDADEGAFEVVDVGDAGNGVLQAGPPALAALTPGEQGGGPPRPRPAPAQRPSPACRRSGLRQVGLEAGCGPAAVARAGRGEADTFLPER